MANVYYRTGDHTVHALNPADGAERWTFSEKEGVFAPIAVGSLVYVEDFDRLSTPPSIRLYALNAATGAVVWSAPGGVNPTVVNGAVYVLVNREIDCYDAATGTLRWQHRAPGVRLAVTSDTVYVWDPNLGTAVTPSLTAINTSDGAIRWTFASGNKGVSDLVVGDGVVYIESGTSQGERLLALSTTDGSQIWSTDVPAPQTEAIALASGVLYVDGGSAGMTAYRASDGALLWQNTHPLVGRFTVAGNVVYANTFDAAVLAVDAGSGKQLWVVAVGIYGSVPLVANGMLYVAAGFFAQDPTSQLVAVNVSTGAIAWQHQVDGSLGPPVIAAGVVYTYNSLPDNGPSPTVYAFNATNGVGLWQHQTSQNLESTLAVTNGVSA